MAGLVVKLGLGETRGSYVKPGNSGSPVWSIQTLANFSKLVLKFNMHYDVDHQPGLCQCGLFKNPQQSKSLKSRLPYARGCEKKAESRPFDFLWSLSLTIRQIIWYQSLVAMPNWNYLLSEGPSCWDNSKNILRSCNGPFVQELRANKPKLYQHWTLMV